MSRCFSFPPPEYVWNGVSGDALIDLLKKLGEKRKNENDEKRKKRKREEKAKKREQCNRKMQNHNERSDDAELKSEDVEKSDLTEEHAQPIGNTLCYTSDCATRSSSTRSKRTCTESEIWKLSDQELRERKMSDEDAMYRALIENWDMIPLQYEVPVDDDYQKWLSERKYNDDYSGKRLKTNNNCSFGYSSSAWPRAQYIEEADIYALPYTIPV